MGEYGSRRGEWSLQRTCIKLVFCRRDPCCMLHIFVPCLVKHDLASLIAAAFNGHASCSIRLVSRVGFFRTVLMQGGSCLKRSRATAFGDQHFERSSGWS